MPQRAASEVVLEDAAFKLRSSWREWIVEYMGLPLIGGIGVFLKLLASLSTEVAAMVGGGGD